MNDSSGKRVSAKGYYAAGAVLFVALAGAGLLVAFFVMSVMSIGDLTQQVVLPQGGVVTLSEPGEYTVYYEPTSSFAGKRYQTSQQLPSITIEAQPATGGPAIPMGVSSMSSNYDLSGRSGYSIGTLAIPAAGDYQITGVYDQPGEPDRVFAVGKGIVGKIFTAILSLFAAFGVGGLGLVIAVILFIVTLVRRSRAASA